MLEIKKKMCTKIRASVLENPGLKIKASMLIRWVSMPEIQATVPRHRDQGVCYYRCLKQRQCTWNQGQDA